MFDTYITFNGLFSQLKCTSPSKYSKCLTVTAEATTMTGARSRSSRPNVISPLLVNGMQSWLRRSRLAWYLTLLYRRLQQSRSPAFVQRIRCNVPFASRIFASMSIIVTSGAARGMRSVYPQRLEERFYRFCGTIQLACQILQTPFCLFLKASP